MVCSYSQRLLSEKTDILKDGCVPQCSQSRPWVIRLKPPCLDLVPWEGCSSWSPNISLCVSVCVSLCLTPGEPGVHGSLATRTLPFCSHWYKGQIQSAHTHTHTHTHPHTHTQAPPHTRSPTPNSSVLFCSAGSDELARSLLPSPPHLLVIRVPMRLTGSICRLLSLDPSLPLCFSSSPPLLHHCVEFPSTAEWCDNVRVVP